MYKQVISVISAFILLLSLASCNNTVQTADTTASPSGHSIEFNEIYNEFDSIYPYPGPATWFSDIKGVKKLDASNVYGETINYVLVNDYETYLDVDKNIYQFPDFGRSFFDNYSIFVVKITGSCHDFGKRNLITQMEVVEDELVVDLYLRELIQGVMINTDHGYVIAAQIRKSDIKNATSYRIRNVKFETETDILDKK